MVRARVNGGSNYDSLNGTNSQLSAGVQKEATRSFFIRYPTTSPVLKIGSEFTVSET